MKKILFGFYIILLLCINFSFVKGNSYIEKRWTKKINLYRHQQQLDKYLITHKGTLYIFNELDYKTGNLTEIIKIKTKYLLPSFTKSGNFLFVFDKEKRQAIDCYDISLQKLIWSKQFTSYDYYLFYNDTLFVSDKKKSGNELFFIKIQNGNVLHKVALDGTIFLQPFIYKDELVILNTTIGLIDISNSKTFFTKINIKDFSIINSTNLITFDGYPKYVNHLLKDNFLIVYTDDCWSSNSYINIIDLDLMNLNRVIKIKGVAYQLLLVDDNLIVSSFIPQKGENMTIVSKKLTQVEEKKTKFLPMELLVYKDNYIMSGYGGFLIMNKDTVIKKEIFLDNRQRYFSTIIDKYLFIWPGSFTCYNLEQNEIIQCNIPGKLFNYSPTEQIFLFLTEENKYKNSFFTNELKAYYPLYHLSAYTMKMIEK